MNLKTKLVIALRVSYVVILVGGTTAFTLGYLRARNLSRMKTCQENLTKIDGAKEEWALEHKKKPGDKVTMEELDDHDPRNASSYWKACPRRCPSGGLYILNPIGVDPVCASGLPGHSLKEARSTYAATRQ